MKLSYILDGCEAYAHDSEDTTAVVQYYDGQVWYYLCSDGFTDQNADVICEENFGTESETHTLIGTTDLTYGYEILSHRHACVGNEDSLCHCPTIPQNCTSMSAVAIMCQRPGNHLLFNIHIGSSLIELCFRIWLTSTIQWF